MFLEGEGVIVVEDLLILCQRGPRLVDVDADLLVVLVHLGLDPTTHPLFLRGARTHLQLDVTDHSQRLIYNYKSVPTEMRSFT